MTINMSPKFIIRDDDHFNPMEGAYNHAYIGMDYSQEDFPFLATVDKAQLFNSLLEAVEYAQRFNSISWTVHMVNCTYTY